ncbi:MAG: asparagine synthase (glutamine-hydrolyzing) [Bacteroidota bacterium]|jgi:asparagine synthase (glutamine-hydrolysing)
MCGINGIFSSSIPVKERIKKVEQMNNSLAHRGPDASGLWSSNEISLGHKRLSIIDLDSRSNQPLHSFDGRYTIVYNGEIYNFKDLRFELSRAPHGSSFSPYPFKTSSDTEVLLAAYIRYGKSCIDLFNGMFAFAIWDNFNKELFLGRDRLGVKPLYYFYESGNFIFSSELRSILASGLVSRKLSGDALIDYLSYQTVHAPDTIIEDVKMLMPGNYISLLNNELKIHRWWNPANYLNNGNEKQNLNEIHTEIKNLFFNSVEKRMVADVRSGAFLSGGIDSTAVVGAMSQISSQKIDTFNVSFSERNFSEDEIASKIAKKFNTNHHSIKLSPQNFLNLLPEALNAMDHPSGDGPNSYVISKSVREMGIKMALTGLGGDELFCGYGLFKHLYSIEKKWWLNAVPRFSRMAFASIYSIKDSSVKSKKLAELLSKPIINFEYSYPVMRKTLNDSLVKGLSKREQLPMNKVYRIVRNENYNRKQKMLSKYSVAEMSTYLHNVLLRDADQMSMAVGLELRVPFLDYRLVEFVLSLNDKFKYPVTPKKLLCDSIPELIPQEVWNRPKMGFTLPWENWMRSELKNFCENQINLLSQRNIINGDVLNAIWLRFLKSDKEITWSRMWHLVALGYWIDKNGIE